MSARLGTDGHRRSSIFLTLCQRIFCAIAVSSPDRPTTIFKPRAHLSSLRRLVNGRTPPTCIHSISFNHLVLIQVRADIDRAGISTRKTFSRTLGNKTKNAISTRIGTGCRHVVHGSGFAIIALKNGPGRTTHVTDPGSVGRLDSVVGRNTACDHDGPNAPVTCAITFLGSGTLTAVTCAAHCFRARYHRFGGNFIGIHRDNNCITG